MKPFFLDVTNKTWIIRNWPAILIPIFSITCIPHVGHLCETGIQRVNLMWLVIGVLGRILSPRMKASNMHNDMIDKSAMFVDVKVWNDITAMLSWTFPTCLQHVTSHRFRKQTLVLWRILVATSTAVRCMSRWCNCRRNCGWHGRCFQFRRCHHIYRYWEHRRKDHSLVQRLETFVSSIKMESAYTSLVEHVDRTGY